MINEEKTECHCPICFQNFRGYKPRPGLGKKDKLICARETFKQHILKCLETNKSYKCEMCKEKFSNKQKYEYVSQWNFENEFVWRCHMNEKHNHIDNVQENSLESKIHTNEKDKIYCQFCKKMIAKSDSLDHMRQFHQIEYELSNPNISTENANVPKEFCKQCLNNGKEKCKECGCMKCGGKTPMERLLFCEKCQFYIHFECLPHPIESLEELPGGPDADFFCPSCSDDNLKEILDSQMLDRLKNAATSRQTDEIENDEINSDLKEIDPLDLETQDTILKAEQEITSSITKNTVVMKPNATTYEKDQGYCEICKIMIIPSHYEIGWKEHMKRLHQLEYEIVKSNVSTQNHNYYPLDVSDCNVEVVAPTDLNEDINHVQVFAPIPSKESIETVDYPIDFLLQNSNNTDVGGVVVKQILGDFALEHKFN